MTIQRGSISNSAIAIAGMGCFVHYYEKLMSSIAHVFEV